MTSVLTDEEVTTFFQSVERSVGVHLDLSKKYLLAARLKSVCVASDFPSVDSLVRELNRSRTGELHELAYAALTTNETSFFRDPAFFDFLKNRVLPNLIRLNSNQRKIRIWSAAVSSGQEVYSLAMLMRLYFPELQRWEVEILGSDVASPILEKAKLGIFNESEVNRGLSDIFLSKFFTKIDKSLFELSSSIRDMVKFQRFNLIKDPFPFNYYDIILLRNVLIYFSLDNKVSVLDKSSTALADTHGLLFLGGAESTNGHAKLKVNLDPQWTFYQKKK